MTILYIPLYYSNLQLVVPKDEEILFSAFYKVLFKENMIDPFKANKKWDTHVLFTNKGFYCGEYQRKRQPKVKFISWGRVKKIKKKSLVLSNYTFKMKREPNFESIKDFRKRKNEFLEKIQPIMNEGIKHHFAEFSELTTFSERERTRPTKVFGDKDVVKFRRMMEFMELQRRKSREDKISHGTIYKDMRKKRMKNKVNMQVFDLIIASFTLPLLFPSIYLYASKELVGFANSMLTVSIIILVTIGFHRYWIRKSSFTLHKLAVPLAQAKTKTAKGFLEIFSDLTKNYDGAQVFKLMDLGSKAYMEREFEKCASIFKQILKFNTQINMNWYMLLESLYYLSRWDEMVSVGEEAIKLHPHFGPLYHWIADAYKQLGKKDKAQDYYLKGIEELNKVIKDDPNDDNNLNSLGYCYLGMDDYENALECYKKAVKIQPNSEHHLHSLGQTYMKMGSYDKAIKELEKSLKYNPKHSYAWFDLGLIYEDQNQVEKAIECFEKAVEYYPQWVKIREKLISLKPDSPVLIKKTQEVREKAAGDYLYDSLHTRGREDKVKKREIFLNRLLTMNEMQLISFLTSDIMIYERRFKQLNRNKFIPAYAIDLLNIQKEYKVQLLKNLKEYPNYISEFRTTIKNDIEFFKMLSERKGKSKEKHLVTVFNLLLEMPYVQLVKYFKEEVIIKHQMIKLKPMDEKEFEMRNLALNYVKETLENLEKNRANIQGFRKEIRSGLDDLTNGIISVFSDKLYYLF